MSTARTISDEDFLKLMQDTLKRYRHAIAFLANGTPIPKQKKKRKPKRTTKRPVVGGE